MPYYAKIISVFLLATVKFFYSPLYAYLIDLKLEDSIITIVSAGMVSFLFFYYISYFVIISTKFVRPVARIVAPKPLKKRINSWLQKQEIRRQNRRLFTRRNRLMVRIRNYGMWAIMITMPFLISIPVGAFLLRRYYERRRGVVWLSLLFIALEGAILCWVVWNVPDMRP